MSSKGKIVLAVVITAVISIAATLWASVFVRFIFSAEGDKAFLNKIQTVEAILDTRYLYDYDKTSVREDALKAYVDSLDEPYTEYYPAEAFEEYTETIQDGYTGIGIIVSVNENDQIEVIAPFEGSPAYEAGIEPGDILKAVNGTEYNGGQLSEAVDAIKSGSTGTTVDVTILKSGGGEVTLTVERRDISDNSVKTEMLGDNIGYMRITQFNMKSEDGSHSTYSEFEDKLEDLQSNGAEKLIIDLRDNPGGVLTEVCKIADKLLGEGVITYTEDKNGKRKNYSSDAESIDIPIVVLINGNSASASEVLTGALKDYNRATIVGQKSYGKGIVQDVYTLYDGSGISLTSAKYYTPNGVCIHEIGIEPDVAVEMPAEYKDTYSSLVEHDKDTQLQKAIEIIKEK